MYIRPLAFPTAHNHTPHQAHTSTRRPVFKLYHYFFPFTLKIVTEVNVEVDYEHTALLNPKRQNCVFYIV